MRNSSFRSFLVDHTIISLEFDASSRVMVPSGLNDDLELAKENGTENRNVLATALSYCGRSLFGKRDSLL